MIPFFLPPQNIDKFDMIVQADQDGGDTLNRTGLYYYGIALLGQREDYLGKPLILGFLETLHILEWKEGVYIRHPDQDKWYSNPRTTSRDQLIPIIIASRHFGLELRLSKLFQKLFWRLGFCMNTIHNGQKSGWKIPDLLLPHHWALFFRSQNNPCLKPMLYFTDMFLLLDTITQVLKGYLIKTHTDDLNITLMNIQAHQALPTPLSRLSNWILKNLRRGGLQNAWNAYFAEETNAPPFHKLYRSIILLDL